MYTWIHGAKLLLGTSEGLPAQGCLHHGLRHSAVHVLVALHAAAVDGDIMESSY